MDTEDVAARVAEAERSGFTRRDAIASVAAETGLAKRAVYDAVVKAKTDQLT
jgi:16S rRNA (cytidine1402-2'-O)-methyltransferase